MSKPTWAEDECTTHDPDHEGLADACLRVTGRPLTDFMLHGTKVDLGDAVSYALDGWLAVSSYPGASAIYRSKTL